MLMAGTRRRNFVSKFLRNGLWLYECDSIALLFIVKKHAIPVKPDYLKISLSIS
jgi:hypothetical protein